MLGGVLVGVLEVPNLDALLECPLLARRWLLSHDLHDPVGRYWLDEIGL